MIKKINKSLVVVAATLLLASSAVKADSYYDRKVSLFELLPITENDIVFVGNSITDGAELQELFGLPNVKNRGITSDVISGVDKRIETTLKNHPKKVFLLIGANDISHNLTVSQIAEKYERLVAKMKRLSPDTKFYLQGIMPINNDFKRYKTMYGKEKVIPELNKKIEEIAKKYNCTYISLTKALEDPATGKLRKEFTNDGLHLTGAGYKAWVGVLEPYVNGYDWFTE
ncbi:MAG: GDSL-type esterase/lipase family protein [Prevotella sp.]|nr:GDSL-type esterase/lipase family protein [Prevotella sp.]MCM1075223.1 GDSL-type esterase/lipase family protein [Ruminococcus sp.]